MKKLTLFLLWSFFSNAQQVKVSSGSLREFPEFKSEFVTSRNVAVWLPDGYSNKQKYSVLYMHDGQMLFDPDLSWNKQSWDADATAGKLNDDNGIQKFIIVAIYNNGTTRHSDYFPQKVFETLTKKQQDSLYDLNRSTGNPLFGVRINSDNYLKFIVNELKPFVDKEFFTYKDKGHTFIAGSSMGGLISMYAICEYPDVFGGAACLSTHWPGIFLAENNPIPDAFLKYLKAKLPNPKNHKIYFDYGDQTLDAMYPPLQQKVDVVMKEKGFDDKNWTTKFFPGQDHSENAWKERLHIPLTFLLRK